MKSSASAWSFPISAQRKGVLSIKVSPALKLWIHPAQFSLREHSISNSLLCLPLLFPLSSNLIRDRWPFLRWTPCWKLVQKITRGWIIIIIRNQDRIFMKILLIDCWMNIMELPFTSLVFYSCSTFWDILTTLSSNSSTWFILPIMLFILKTSSCFWSFFL